MSDNESRVSYASKASRKSTRGKSKKDYNKKSYRKRAQGDELKLGYHVYLYNSKNQRDMYIMTTEAIGEYVGKTYSRAMRVMVKYLEEEPPEEPTEPREVSVTEVRLKKYDRELTEYLRENAKYKEHKSKVFVIRGQCTLNMKNKLESMPTYEELEKKDDVVGLLKLLKDLTFTTTDVQYEHWAMVESLKKAVNMEQEDGEGLAGYYRRFWIQIDATEAQWGSLVPTNLGNDDETRDKFLACLFLAGENEKRYGRFVGDLSNSYLGGQNKYPKSVEGTMQRLTHYKDEKVSYNRDSGKPWIIETSFAQQNKANIRCYKCQKMGHYANECEEESDDESKSRSSAASIDSLSRFSQSSRTSRSSKRSSG